MDPSAATYPMPVVLVGALVNGKANYMAVAWFSQVSAEPPMIAVALNRSRWTVEGVVENKSFSINVPGRSLVDEADYCGLVSGEKHDKSSLFSTFYGDLKTAPMIEECPLCFECSLANSLDLPSHTIFVGKVAAVYADQHYVKGGKLDLRKMEPFVLDSPGRSYMGLGSDIAKAWSAGKKLIKK